MLDFTVEEAGFDYTRLKAYSGYYLDENNLLKSASGGAASVLAESIINHGGIVFGVSYSSDFKRAEWRCASNLQDLECLRNSKYCESTKEIIVDGEARSLYPFVEEKIKEGILILFIGLGCDVAALKSMCEAKKIDVSNLYTVEIICHGPTYSFVQEQYITMLEKEYKSSVISFSIRYKKNGWMPSYVRAEFANGDVFEKLRGETEFGITFEHLSKLSCYNCKFKGANHKADLACGDYWGLTKSMKGWNDNGVSLLLVQTNRGEELLQMIDEKAFHIEEADIALALKNNPLYYKCREKDEHYDKFLKMIKERGIHYAVNHYPTTPKKRIKRAIKRYLAKSVINTMKK
ncbi:Coenzyme F420 hydrogenase/dehydrogenase, beta subunit C-terminal domain [Pseudobutyrivibrio xylanivorans]|uniref:Coenzyme F420 hydrogenase/dehydrogenase beta subunit C-terminal domain-containing protein n=1 Tax=Pseudobutyrivibrio xylanivorans TaxID=185007 RepID=A0A5P6VW95_PSEXY|nr:Coenzyme F420 hydrogenase/dehydrogenase, beta subunit C-terminal domain [Pseudobutyrivibrio xylanivorans]QFJ56291.1 hypothetical protein FXF36_15345 [Pseudobutyrivibrio xylanivorans]